MMMRIASLLTKIWCDEAAACSACRFVDPKEFALLELELVQQHRLVDSKEERHLDERRGRSQPLG